MELSFLESLKIPQRRLHFFLAVSILLILAGNKEIIQSLNEFKIRPDMTTYYGVSCP